MRRSSQQGFTLIEAAVAIAVVAILSGIIVPLVIKNLRDSQVARARNDVQVLAAAIASQLKDTGRRPTAAGGPGGATGAAAAIWKSGAAGAAQMPIGAAAGGANNTFTNLFTYSAADATNGPLAQTMFYGAAAGVTSANEFSYKGPYLANDVAMTTDPWGYKYLILGYGLTGQTGSLPIYIVCAGPDGAIDAANYAAGMGPATGIWVRTTAVSMDDIVVRVN